MPSRLDSWQDCPLQRYRAPGGASSKVNKDSIYSSYLGGFQIQDWLLSIIDSGDLQQLPYFEAHHTSLS